MINREMSTPYLQSQYQTYGDYIYNHMLYEKGLPPAIYKIIKDPFSPSKIKPTWKPVKYVDKFKLPPKLYGKVNEYSNYIWNRFKNSNIPTNVLITGLKGTGKTETAKAIANLAVENGYPVYMVEGIEANDDLLTLLDNLDNCIIFIDEFAKIFKGPLQNKMLTMLSNLANKHKMWLLTENETYGINQFLLNRPGRIRYHIEYGKLKRDVVEEYCRDRGVNEKFLKNLLVRYENTHMFTFDQLQAIVDEHLYSPNLSLDDILEILNITGLDLDLTFKIVKVTNKKGEPIYKPEIDGLKASEIEPNVYINICKYTKNKNHEGGFCYKIVYKIQSNLLFFNPNALKAEEKIIDENKYKVIFKDEDLVIYYETTNKELEVEEIDPGLICEDNKPKVLGNKPMTSPANNPFV